MDPEVKDLTEGRQGAAGDPNGEGGKYTWPEGFEWDFTDVVIEDGQAVDSFLSELQYALLTEPLRSSWAGPGEGRPFLAFANVGLFYQKGQPPLVPDVMLSLDVRIAPDPSRKET